MNKIKIKVSKDNVVITIYWNEESSKLFNSVYGINERLTQEETRSLYLSNETYFDVKWMRDD